MDINLNMCSDELSNEITENSKNKANWVHESNIDTLAILSIKRNKDKINQKHKEIKEIKE